MIDGNTEQIIKDHLATLPEPVKKAIASFDWAREVFDIGRKHAMHVDRIGELQTEVMLVVLGLISPRDFQNELFDRIEPNREIALEISDEVNQKVFIRIRNFMKEYYEKNENLGISTNSTTTESKEGELENSDKSVLRGAGISIGDDINEPDSKPENTGSEVEPEDDGKVVFEDEPSPAPEIKQATSPFTVPSAISKPEVRKSTVSVISPEKTPKGFLDPYREVVE